MGLLQNATIPDYSGADTIMQQQHHNKKLIQINHSYGIINLELVPKFYIYSVSYKNSILSSNFLHYLVF